MRSPREAVRRSTTPACPKSAQPLGQKRARNAGKTTLEVIEMRNIGRQFTDDEHCPAIGEKLRRSGDRTILAVKMHGAPR